MNINMILKRNTYSTKKGLSIFAIAFIILIAIAGIGIAKYTSVSQLEQEARVAEFNVSADSGEFKDGKQLLNFDVENDTIEYIFTFRSDSEVAVMTGMQIPYLPTGLDADLYLGDSTTPCEKTIEKIFVKTDLGPEHVANKYTFSTVNVFGPGQKSETAKFVFKLADGESLLGEVEYKDIVISVLFDQID